VIADFFGDVHDFFDSTTWTVVWTGAIALVALFWVATIAWVRKDAKRRIASKPVVWLATLIGAIPPFLGPLIYMLFRPPEYLEDVRERELEIRAMEERLNRRDHQCPVCRAEIEDSFLVCPVCTTKLRQACASCKAPLETLWQVCPYCETPVETPTTIAFPPPLQSPPRSSTGSSN
jgi:hypothetical protein